MDASTNASSNPIIANAQDKAADAFSMITSNVMMIILFFLVLSLTVYVVIHLVKTFNKTDLKTVTLLKKPVRIPQSAVDTINNDVDMPSLYNGKEYSYSVWFYVDTHHQTENPKMLLYRGDEEGVQNNPTPIFYMSPNYVELNVLVKTDMDKSDGVTRGSLSDLHKYRDCDYIKLSVPYVPMQRWVNAILVVDNEYVQLFFDGELRKVVDITATEKIDNYNNPSITTSRNNGDDMCKKEEDATTNVVTSNTCCDESVKCCGSRIVGTNTPGKNLYIGKSFRDEVVDGYMSKVQFFNYAVTVDHAKVIYQAGPLHLSILSMIGLPLYGIRNPFYKIDSVQEVGKTSSTTDDK